MYYHHYYCGLERIGGWALSLGTNQLSCLKRTRVPLFPGFVRPPNSQHTHTRDGERGEKLSERTRGLKRGKRGGEA